MNAVSGWSRITLANKPVDLFDPPGGAKHVAMYLHPLGLESLADNPVYTAKLAKHRIACIAPFGGYSWWSNRICTDFDPELTAHQHIVKNIVPFARERWPTVTRNLAALGISMGGQGAIRLGFLDHKTFPVVAGVASAFDYHDLYGQGLSIDNMYRSKEDCRQDTAVLQVRPNATPPHIGFWCDPTDEDWIRGNDRLRSKLIATGVEHTCDLETVAGGHSWDYFNAVAERVVQFMVNGLEKESRRLM